MRQTSLAEVTSGGPDPVGPAGIPLDELRDMRIAVVHDWCPHFRGGERVVSRICRQFPNAEVFTLFDFLPADVKEEYFADVAFHTSPADRLPLVQKYYRSLFFLCPFLIEQFDVTGFDAVISSSAAYARGVITRPDQPHLCYVHSPARYAWDEQFSYFEQGRIGYRPKGLVYRAMLHHLRMWDIRTAHGPDLMLANSSFVRARIRRIYGRDAAVVHPPVEVDRLECQDERDDYYVAACFAAPYKRTDLLVRAFTAMPSRRLIVVGDQASRDLRALAGPNVTFAGYLPRDEYVRTIGRAKAMVFAGCEDFGIALAEAQACGTPLVAYGRGGAADIVRPFGSARRPTGVLFPRQSADAVVEAVAAFEDAGAAITPRACRENAERFSEARFDAELLDSFAAVVGLNGQAATPSAAAIASR
jgi:glycosyltransferase involved in cell wall biosynthesis